MNANGHFDEDDLAFYAMHLLAQPEASAMARRLAESEEARRGLAELQSRLELYAESAVELQAVPPGSLDRLMRRIAKEVADRRVLTMPPTVPEPFATSTSVRSQNRAGGLLPWFGWALAAGMTVAVGKMYQDRTALHRMLAAQTGQAVHMSADRTDVIRERDELAANLAERDTELKALRMETADAKGQANGLRAATASQAARLNDQASKLTQQTAKEEKEAALVENAARDRNSLQGMLASQANQVAQLSTDVARARQVQEALNDPTALRVTLTKPKTKPLPAGRATYVANRGTLVFLASNLAPLDGNKVYELWLMPADGSKPIPAGTFTPDALGNASVISAQLSRAVAAKGFAVTVENAGGSQTPTLPILLAGL